MSNPYFDPNADADLFAEDEEQASTNEISTDFIIGSQIPEDMKNALRDHVNIDISASANSKMAPELHMVVSMIEIFDDVSSFQKSGSLIAAMAAVLDEMTNGRLRVYNEKYEAERRIIASHIIKSFSKEFTVLLNVDSMQHSWTAELIDYVESYGELVEHTLAQAIDVYRSSCKELDVEPDENLITTGIYSVRDYITRAALVSPPAQSDI